MAKAIFTPSEGKRKDCPLKLVEESEDGRE